MKVAISGSSGFIGKHLVSSFLGKGMDVVPVGRSLLQSASDEELQELVAGCNVVINLAGVSINQRWTDAAKRRIMDSRVQVTRRLVAAVNAQERKPELFISTSAVGIYPSTGIYNESSAAEGTGFLAEVCHRWEAEVQKLSPDVRLVITRLGVVLGADGGALPKMLLPFRLYAGGRIASGEQGFSWIHIEDVVSVIQFVITHPEVSGILNLVSPQPLHNADFTQAAADVLRRPAWLTVPRFVFRILYGEGEVLVTEGQEAYPARLLSAGYVFLYSDIRVALRSLLNP